MFKSLTSPIINFWYFIHKKTDKRLLHKNRYDNGNVEFKSWLEALVNEKDSELNLLKAKFDIIQAENKIYQAMGGKAK